MKLPFNSIGTAWRLTNQVFFLLVVCSSGGFKLFTGNTEYFPHTDNLYEDFAHLVMKPKLCSGSEASMGEDQCYSRLLTARGPWQPSAQKLALFSMS